MFIIRDVFTCKPGEAKHLVKKFKAVAPHMADFGAASTRIMTDAVADYWTVILEIEVESVGAWMDAMANARDDDDRWAPMEGYMDHLTGGKREIFRVE